MPDSGNCDIGIIWLGDPGCALAARLCFMLKNYGPEKAAIAPLAPDSLDQGATCLGIRVLCCV